jgi:prepilin-type processing-associated H-X9-DG protein
MNPLNNEQKELLFDYCMGLTSQQETDEAETLISSYQEAAEIHRNLKNAIEPLSSIPAEPCPDELVDRTLGRVGSLKDSGKQLRELLASEQVKQAPIRIGVWRNWFETAAVAAAVLFVAGVLIPTLSVARHRYTVQNCKTQLGSIFQGLKNYIADHDGQSPAVATAAGAPWWKLGNQGRENHSNDRHIYLLPKYGYVDIENFVCPACKSEVPAELTDSQIKTLKDFPGREYITYSFQIRCRKTSNGRLLCRKVVMADMNPLFETLPDDFDREFRVQLDRTLLTLNSKNHDRRGQNVLFGDGHVEYLKSRFIKLSEDDMYTLRNTDVYRGYEVPSCETDFFLAP